MKKRTIKMNKGNWSGEEVEIVAREYANGHVEFSIYEGDETYTMVFKEERVDYGDDLGVDVFTSAKVFGSYRHGGEPVFGGIKDDRGTWFFSTMGISREAADPVVAAAQLLYNIV